MHTCNVYMGKPTNLSQSVFCRRQWSVEPNDSNGVEDCVEIHTDGLYNDRICTAKVGFICEYSLPYGRLVLSLIETLWTTYIAWVIQLIKIPCCCANEWLI